MTQPDFETDDYLASVERINAALSRLGGWVLNPHHIGGIDMLDLTAVVEGIEEGTLPVEQSSYDRVCAIVQQCIFAPRYRAFYLWRASQLPPLSKVGHYLERAHTRFFARDHFTATLLLLAAVEGVMREHTGYRKPSGDHRPILRLIEKHSPETTGVFARRYPVYRKWLVYAIEELFKGTEQARRDHVLDITAAFRSNAFHGETAGAYYAAADCTRLFALFDLYVEVLTCETGLGYANFIPEKGTCPFVDERETVYLALLLDSHLVAEQKREEALMRDHPSYVPETRQDDIVEVLVKSAANNSRRLGKIMKNIREGKEPTEGLE
jgi:hypothetical protein